MRHSGDPDSNIKLVLSNKGVTSAAVDAITFQNYGGGIFTGDGCSDVNLNRAVSVFGYDSGYFYWETVGSWVTKKLHK